MKFNNKLLIACTSIVLTVGSALAQEKPLPLDAAVRTGKLPNGFTYYIRHNEEPKKRVVFYLANKVGSVLENDDQQGLAHFMEHMSFNGTTHYPKNELVNYLQKAGVRFGADINAYTSFDETVYQLPLPADKPEIIANGLQIMRDWAHGATLDATEIDKERGVVLEEKRLRKGASERMRAQYWPTMLNNSRYSLRIPIGTDEVLNNFKPETIRSFYNDWYRPDLQALIVVGDIDVDAIEKVVIEKFSDLKNPDNEKPRTKYTVPLTGKEQFIAVTDPEMTSTVAEVSIKQLSQPNGTATALRADMVRSLFNAMINNRCAELLRQAQPPFLQGSAGIGAFIGGLDNFTASVTAKSGGLENAFKAIWRETERVKRFGFTATEFERAKQSYLSSVEAVVKEKDKTNSSSFVQEYLNYFLKGEAAPGIDTEFGLIKTYLPQIAVTEVNALAKTYIRDDNRDILLMAPEKDRATLPSHETINAWIKAVEAEDIKPYVDEVSTQPLLKIQPKPGSIVKQQKDDALNITTLTLKNGVKVVLKPTDFKNNEVLFSASSPGGTSLYADADYQSAANASALISSFGAGNYSGVELRKFLSGKQLSVQPYIAERSQGLSGGYVPKDAETAFQLMYAFLTEPGRDEKVFEGIIARSKSSLANRGNDPSTVFKDSVSAILGNYNIRRTAPTLAKIEQVNLDRAEQIYRECFSDAADMVFTFTGNFEVDSIKPLIVKYLGGLPATWQHKQARDLGITIPPGKTIKNIYKGTEPKATVQLLFFGPFNYTAADRLKMAALKETLQIRLTERLREEESGVYSPSVSATTGKYPKARFNFGISFGCAPQNVDKLIASALDEVNKLKTQGPAQINIDKYKAEDSRARETAIKTNRWWLSYISGQIQDAEPMHQLDNYAATMATVNVESLKAAAAKYLNDENFVRLVLLPEK